MGVIDPCNSTWHRSIVLVPKPGGSILFCIDFRDVNKIASFNAYPKPHANALLSQLGEAFYMSALDF